jgi:hypothetical protein
LKLPMLCGYGLLLNLPLSRYWLFVIGYSL